MNQRVLVSVII